MVSQNDRTVVGHGNQNIFRIVSFNSGYLSTIWEQLCAGKGRSPMGKAYADVAERDSFIYLTEEKVAKSPNVIVCSLLLYRVLQLSEAIEKTDEKLANIDTFVEFVL